MENPFKEILNYEKLPLNFKEKVMKDISLVKLTIDMADLFMVQYPNTIGSFLDTDTTNK